NPVLLSSAKISFITLFSFQLREISDDHIPSANEELHARMARTQSLRDITTKFEKLAASPLKSDVTDRPQIPSNSVTERLSLFESKLSSSAAVLSGNSGNPDQNAATHASICEQQNVSKESLLALYRNLEDHLQKLRSERAGRITKTSRTNSQHVNLIQLSDAMQQFHNICAVYAEQVTPHSKFRYRELLNRIELFMRQLRSCATSSVNPELAESHILPQFEATLHQIHQLINR
ncbi:hypothetical protein OSTOST_06817, partial [Ostertagia ostertagi]